MAERSCFYKNIDTKLFLPSIRGESALSTENAWQWYGEHDPYYAVLAHDRFHKETLTPTRRSEFFETGESSVAEILALLRRSEASGRRALAIDFGCGVGRLSLPLAREYERVVGIDVSAHMLTELRSNAKRLGLFNVDGVLSVEDAPEGADLVMSRIVLQHIPLERGFELIAKLWGKLGPGGALAIEVPISSRFDLPVRAGRWLRDRLPLLQVAANLARGRPLRQPGMQMNVYPLNRLCMSLFSTGATQIQISPSEPDHMHDGVVIVAVKPGGAPKNV